MYLECLAIALLGQETGRVCSTDSWTVCLKSSTESKEQRNEDLNSTARMFMTECVPRKK